VQALAGALAGGVARCFVAPLDVIKIRLQARIALRNAQPPTCLAPPALTWHLAPHAPPQVQIEPTRSGLGKYTGLRQACALIVKEEGVRGLWRGTAPALLLWVPYTAIQFAALARFNAVSSS
jgi:solute carrier family 25 thiamine pyrophosphate transporter 19